MTTIPALRSNFWPLGLVPFVLLASLLFPALHLHRVDGHDHGSHPHGHVIIHADFLSASALDHHHARSEEPPPGDAAPTHDEQSALSAVLARTVNFVPLGLQQSTGYLALDVTPDNPGFAFFSRLLKLDHFPPLQQVLRLLSSPRSPPTEL